jgi:hypothetical protein
MVNSFAISTGITAGTANGPPYVTGALNAPALWSIAPSLQDLGQVATMTALFDQYRIDKYEIKFVPQSTAINVMNTASPNDSVPSLYVVMDFDDSNALASLAAALEYDSVQVVQYGEGLMVTINPSMALSTWASGAFSGYNIVKSGWLDCANTAIPHYGIKGAFAGLQALSTSNCYWDVFCKVFVSFRNTR